MGLFYGNLTVYRPLRRSLLTALRRLRRSAFVSPTVYGHTVIFDRAVDEQKVEAIERLGCQLTKTLGCMALAAALHDDDVLYLWLFQKGKLHDRYNSLPGYFDPKAAGSPPLGGDSKLLCEAFARPDHQESVEMLLRANLLAEEPSEIGGELERHASLAHELGMPQCVAGVGYASIAGDYVWDEFRDIAFEKV